jgi:hypothetical protein
VLLQQLHVRHHRLERAVGTLFFGRFGGCFGCGYDELQWLAYDVVGGRADGGEFGREGFGVERFHDGVSKGNGNREDNVLGSGDVSVCYGTFIAASGTQVMSKAS